MTLDEIRAAQERIAGQVLRTPLVESRTLSALAGARVFIKFENLQFTASFKERGALNSLLGLSPAARRRGVITMSAGNHAQAIACHSSRLGIPARIVMPRNTPNTKVENTRVFGARVELYGDQFDETLEYTTRLAATENLTLVHPFNDPRVIAGQGTLGLEIIEQQPDVDTIVVPVGGGGLAGGIGLAVKSMRPDIRLVGVQMERYPAAFNAWHGRSVGATGVGTVAEGIAVKHPGSLTLPLLEQYVDDMRLVGEAAVEDAVFRLLEIEKTVAEGAGAVPLAAVLADRASFAGQNVVLVLSGGNIDMLVLSSVVQRGLARSHRLVRFRVEIADVPQGLADFTRLLAELDSNIVRIEHERMLASSSVRAPWVEVTLQLRGEEQADAILANLAAHGYVAALAD